MREMPLSISIDHRSGCRIFLLGVLLTTVLGCEGLEPLHAFQPNEPSLGTGIDVGVTAGGEGRIRVTFGRVEDAIRHGVRAYVQNLDDNAAAIFRIPNKKHNNNEEFIVIDGLDADTTYRIELVQLNNLGFESNRVTTWNHDSDSASAEVPIDIKVPANTTVEVVTPPTIENAEWQGDGVGLVWTRPSGPAIAGYVVERRQMPSGSWAPLGAFLYPDFWRPQGRDLTAISGNTYRYRIKAEDLNGNQSNASAPTADIIIP